jgi:hypothetical protein
MYAPRELEELSANVDVTARNAWPISLVTMEPALSGAQRGRLTTERQDEIRLYTTSALASGRYADGWMGWFKKQVEERKSEKM